MYGISHQKAGLNWPGRYRQWSRERALADAWAEHLQHKGTKTQRHEGGQGEHARWRRMTGITGAVEQRLTTKERRKGLKRLVERIKKLATEDTENGKGLGFRVQGIGNDEAPPSLTAEWNCGVEEWARAENEGRSVESLCVELQISRARLTMLTKEYCGLTAQELVDGFKVRKLKSALIERLREAAERLWGLPGAWAAWKYENYPNNFSPQRRRDAENRKGLGDRVQGISQKQSRYFRMRPEDYAGEERGEERERRIGELAAAVRRGFDLETWAVGLGFASGARLKRACLNVLGKSLRALERALAAEVVRYYLCAEDKVLREIACQETESPNVIRARWIYHQSDDAPTEPFLDEWSKAEALAREWLERMRKEFG